MLLLHYSFKVWDFRKMINIKGKIIWMIRIKVKDEALILQTSILQPSTDFSMIGNQISLWICFIFWFVIFCFSFLFVLHSVKLLCQLFINPSMFVKICIWKPFKEKPEEGYFLFSPAYSTTSENGSPPRLFWINWG